MAYIEWKDACSYDDEDVNPNRFDDGNTRFVLAHACGFLIKDDDQGVVLCRDLRPNENLISTNLCVPKEYILYKALLQRRPQK